MEKVYQYYNSIAQQLNAGNSIFAPVPSQIKGNMICVSDPGEKVIGVFEAASETIIYKGFSWKNLDEYKSIILESFPDSVGNGEVMNMQPDFWIQF